jgi:hypothetical protein
LLDTHEEIHHSFWCVLSHTSVGDLNGLFQTRGLDDAGESFDGTEFLLRTSHGTNDELANEGLEELVGSVGDV